MNLRRETFEALLTDICTELIRMGVPRARIDLIPSGVDLERFNPVGPIAPRSTDRPRILSVGRLVERKGHADLIRALRLVPKAECLVIGGPPPESSSSTHSPATGRRWRWRSGWDAGRSGSSWLRRAR